MRNVLIRFQVDDTLTEKQFLNLLRKLLSSTPTTLVTDKQIVSGGYHRPVCPKCHVEMRPEHNGVGVLDLADFGPYELYDADLWKCPNCGAEVIGGFANGPISQHWRSDFLKMVEHYRKDGYLVENKG